MYARIAEHYGIPRQEMILIEDAYDTHDEVSSYRHYLRPPGRTGDFRQPYAARHGIGPSVRPAGNSRADRLPGQAGPGANTQPRLSAEGTLSDVLGDGTTRMDRRHLA